MAQQPKTRTRLYWTVFIGMVVLLVAALALTQLRPTEDASAPAVAPPSTEWTTAPEGGVEADLPDTPMRNVPAEPSPDDAAVDE